MIISSHMQKIIHIYPCLLKLSRKQESVTDGRYYYIPHYRGGGGGGGGEKSHEVARFVRNVHMETCE